MGLTIAALKGSQCTFFSIHYLTCINSKLPIQCLKTVYVNKK